MTHLPRFTPLFMALPEGSLSVPRLISSLYLIKRFSSLFLMDALGAGGADDWTFGKLAQIQTRHRYLQKVWGWPTPPFDHTVPPYRKPFKVARQKALEISARTKPIRPSRKHLILVYTALICCVRQWRASWGNGPRFTFA